MILDNADNAELFFPSTLLDAATNASVARKPLTDYLPKRLAPKRSLLITTRNRQLGDILSRGKSYIEVLPFGAKDARDLLRSRGGEIGKSWSDLECDQLNEALNCIPLAIAQSASFMKRYRRSLRRYLESLEEHERNLKDYLKTEFEDYTRERGFPNAVFQTWQISFDQMKKQEPYAAEMLSLIAMFDRQNIPEDLIRQPNQSDNDIFKAIGTLDELSLIIREIGEETFAMHRLVQLSVHLWLEQKGEKRQYEEHALVLLADKFPEGEYGDRKIRDSLFPHAQSVLQYDGNSEASVLRRAKLLYNIGWFDLLQGRYELAYQSSLKSYELYRKQCGKDAKTLASWNLMALIIRYRGKYGESEKLSRRALEEFQQVLGVEHPDTLASVHILAIALWDQGKYKEAEDLNRRALAGREKVLGGEHPDTLTSVDDLALVFQYQGKYEEAERMHRRALIGREKVLGIEHPETLTSVNNLALVLQDQGKYEEAERMHRRTLIGREKVLGIEHPETLTSVNNLALVLQDQGKYEEAERMHRRALIGREKMLGIEHPETLTSVDNLASVLRDQGKYEEAEEMNRRALIGSEKILGIEHPDTLTSVNNLASVLQGQGKYEEAEKMNRRALTGYKKVLGEEHPSTLTSMANLASTSWNQGRWKEAEQLEVKVMETRKKVLGEEHPYTLTSMANLASTYRNQGRWKEAEALGAGSAMIPAGSIQDSILSE
jgi:tetratricopeptide (TPR) repeat protein